MTQTDTQLANAYGDYRRKADEAFKQGDGAMSVGYAAAAQHVLQTYANRWGISTDVAASRFREGRY